MFVSYRVVIIEYNSTLLGAKHHFAVSKWKPLVIYPQPRLSQRFWLANIAVDSSRDAARLMLMLSFGVDGLFGMEYANCATFLLPRECGPENLSVRNEGAD
jgi:hypothetical protein